MKATHLLLGILVLALGITGFSSMFTVHQAEQVLVVQFGNPIRPVYEPGLHFKLPFVQNVLSFDKRVMDFDAAAEEVPTKDQKQLVVDAFARYRIVDPLQFYQAVTDVQRMETQLGNIINSNLRAVFGEVELSKLLTPERARLMKVIAERTNVQGKRYGINVIDVRIKHVDLPEENSQAIFRRMQTQREQEARRIRAEGDKESRRIKADADKQRTIILAKAREQSEILRGEGEGQAQKIYNDAFGKGREFYDFWLSMEAMRQGLDGANTRYVGPPDGDFFRFFGSMSEKEEK